VLRIEASGSKTYYLRYTTEAGKRAMMKLGKTSDLTLAQAKKLAQQHRGEVATGGDPAQERKEARHNYTLREFLSGAYLSWAQANLKSGDYQVQRIAVEFAELLDRPLNKITQWDIEKHRSARLKGTIGPKRKKPPKIQTLNRNTAALRGALSRAYEWDLIPENPLRKLKQMKETEGARTRFFSPQEEAALLQAIEHRNERIRADRRSANAWREVRGYELLPSLDNARFVDYVEPAILFALYQGARHGEQMALLWTDVDFEAGEVHLRGETTKTRCSRTIPLARVTREALTAWRAQNPTATFVFENPETGKPYGQPKKAWQNLLDAAGIQDFRWHDLRHCYATKLVQAGVPLYTIAKLLGHKSIDMVQRHYGHLAQEDLVRAQAVLDAPANVIPFGAPKSGTGA
jgi:integrase